jgi:cytidylate kinase
MSNRHVAIDGPSASGKTVVSHALAIRLGILYLDTGAMYRAVAYLALRNGVELDNDAALVEMFARHSLGIVADEAAHNGYRVLVDEADVSARLTQPEVTAAVSTVAAAPHIRAALVARQRAIAAAEPVVMAGRDIGTVVLPDADLKIYLTASTAVRARRRAEERADGRSVDEVHRALERRDRFDSTRPTSPLRSPEDVADDATVIDSTGKSADDVLQEVLACL